MPTLITSRVRSRRCRAASATQRRPVDSHSTLVPSVSTFAIRKPSAPGRGVPPDTTTPRTAYGSPKASDAPGHVPDSQAAADDKTTARTIGPPWSRIPSTLKPCYPPRTPAGWPNVSRGPRAEPEDHADHDGPGVEDLDQAPRARTPAASTTPCLGRTAAPARGRRPLRRAARRGVRSRSSRLRVGACSGRGTAMGCRSNVAATRCVHARPRTCSRGRGRGSTRDEHRQKLPMRHDRAARAAGTSASERQISTARTLGLTRTPRRDGPPRRGFVERRNSPSGANTALSSGGRGRAGAPPDVARGRVVEVDRREGRGAAVAIGSTSNRSASSSRVRATSRP